MADQPCGALLDALGVTLDVREHQHLTEVLLIGKVIDLTAGPGRARLIFGHTEHADWIGLRGLVSAAQHVLDVAPFTDDDDEGG